MASGLKHYTWTVPGTAQRLIDAMGITAGSSEDLVCKQILIQGVAGNTGSILIGDAGVSTTDYGLEIVKTGPVVTSLGPVQLGIRLQEIYAIAATANDKLHLIFLPN